MVVSLEAGGSQPRPYFFRAARRQPFNSGLTFVISMPGMTMNLQESSSRFFVIVGQFAFDTAILAILIPAEAAIGDGLRADELEAAQERILLGDIERLAEDFDGDEDVRRDETARAGRLAFLLAFRSFFQSLETRLPWLPMSAPDSL